MNRDPYIIQLPGRPGNSGITRVCQRILLLATFILFVAFGSAQQKPSIKVTIDKTKIIIGEPAQLVIETESAKPLFIKLDTIPHFEFLEKPVIDTTEDGSVFKVKGVYKITSFDSGRWSIPIFRLSATAVSDSIPVDVIFSEFDPSQDYHDIKEIIETGETDKKIPWWYYAVGGLILAIIILVILRKKKPVNKIPSRRSEANPYDEAIQRLELLKRNKPASKEYYSEMIEIFRVYVFKTKGIKSLQKTTDDLIIQLALLDLEKQKQVEVAQVLRLSDFVKFAKFNPGAGEDEHAYNTILDFIQYLNKTDLRN